MKKLFLSVVAAAMVFTFTSCGDDLVAPEIVFPTSTETPEFELGDEKAALEGVTAKDNKDGDVTASLKVDGVKFVGKAGLTYTAIDAANNEVSVLRDAIISAKRLEGNYSVESIDNLAADDDPNKSYTFPTVVALQKLDHTKLFVQNFAELEINVDLVGDGTGILTAEHSMDYSGTPAKLTVTASYGPTSNPEVWTLLIVNYKITKSGTGEVVGDYTDTYTLK